MELERQFFHQDRYAYANNNPYKYIDPDGEIAILAAMALAYAVFEVASTTYDVYDAVTTVSDTNASAFDKGISVGGLAAGVFLPGPGAAYKQGVKAATKGVGNLDGIPLKEAKQLMSKWDKATYDNLSGSIRDHAKRHGFGDNIPKYLRKAANFNKKGSKQKTLEDGATRWNRKNGEFLIERNGKIVTYGVNK